MKLVIAVCALFALISMTYAGNARGELSLMGGEVSFDLEAMAKDATWTPWLNGDGPMGTGDYENVPIWRTYYNFRKNGNCAMTCSQPLAVKWELVNTTNEANIDKCLVIDVQSMDRNRGIYPGFNCMNYKQFNSPCTPEECRDAGMRSFKRMTINCDRCPDFKVKYLCPNDHVNVVGKALDDVNKCENVKREWDLQEADKRMMAADTEASMELDAEINEKRELFLEEEAEQEALKANGVENKDATRKRLLDLLETVLENGRN